eukprot:m.337755 g.337755  ORF g.337755 m.337755 type:complete len:317 (+) comp18225_c0_seq1:232-1182(+)
MADYYFEDVAEVEAPKLFALMVMTAGSAIEVGAVIDLCFVHLEDVEALNENSPFPPLCEDQNKINLGLGIGLFSLILSFILLCTQMANGNVGRKVEVSFGILLCIAWALGAAFNTSNTGPFTQTDNGYFATWICLIASGQYLYLSVQTLKTVLDQEITRQNGSLAMVFIASLFELSVAAEYCADHNGCNSKHSVAVAIGVLSFFLSLFQLMFVRLGAPAGIVFGKPIALILLVLWSIAAGVNTSFNGAFATSCVHANGYFATWIAFFCSLTYCYSVILAPTYTGYSVEEAQLLAAQKPTQYGGEKDLGPSEAINLM